MFVSQSFDTDPTTRHTVWTMIVGGYFTWISVYGINQTQVQRYLTVKEKRQAVKYALIAENVSKLVLYTYIFILFTKHNTLRNILNFYQGNLVKCTWNWSSSFAMCLCWLSSIRILRHTWV